MSYDGLSVPVFAGSAAEAAIVRSFLESNGLSTQLGDEHVGTMAPHLASAAGAGAVKVMVARDEVARALELLAGRGRN